MAQKWTVGVCKQKLRRATLRLDGIMFYICQGIRILKSLNLFLRKAGALDDVTDLYSEVFH